MKAIIVGIGKNNEIGANHDMAWGRALPDDLKHFKQLSMGKSIIVGRSTFEHDFRGKPLKDRETIVVTSQHIETHGAVQARSVEQAYALAKHDIVVAGGGQLYAATIDDMDVLYVTEIYATFPEATVFFPAIDPSIWREVSREHHKADERNLYSFDFVEYARA
jgi:dihydrofolate reductase